jgi:hypothetical protein
VSGELRAQAVLTSGGGGEIPLPIEWEARLATGVVWELRKLDTVSPLPEIETRFVGSLAHSVVIFVAEWSGLTEEMECEKLRRK